jgi:hypothetical protein
MVKDLFVGEKLELGEILPFTCDGVVSSDLFFSWLIRH